MEYVSPDDQSNLSSDSSVTLPIIGSRSLFIPLKPFQRDQYCICMAFFVLLIVPLMWLSTTLLPSGYDHFRLPADIRSDGFWTITEPSNAAWTINIKIGNGYLHIYTDLLIYYLGIFVTLCISYIFQQFKKPRKKFRRFIFSKRITLCGNKFMLSLQIGQLIILFLWLSIIIIIFVYFKYYHTFGTYQPLNPFNVEKFIRTCGILSTIFCGLCIIPVARGNQILKYCFGITFESGIKYHRILGVFMILFALIHFIGFISLLIKNDKFSTLHIFSSKMPGPNDWHGDNWTILLMQVIALFVFLPFMITVGHPIIRRKFWEIFYFIHIYGSLVIVIGLMYHANQSWYFMLPGLVLQFYERLWRLWNSSRSDINILSLKQVSTDIVRLRVNIDNQHPWTTLSAYYFINIPHISLFEWHPFSVCNALNAPYTEFYIKNIGNYSCKLLNLATFANTRGQERLSLNKLDIQIEGPFGCDIDYHSYHRLVLIAGGIGITPIHNLFFTLYDQSLSNRRENNDEMYMNQLPSIDLIWIVRYADIFEIFKKSFNKYISSDIPNMKITLYATREEVRYPSTMHGIDNNDNIPYNFHSIDDDVSDDQDQDNNDDDKLSLHVSNNSSISNKSMKFPLHSSMNSSLDKKKKRKKRKKRRSKKSSSSNNSAMSGISRDRDRRTRDVDCPIKWKIGRPDLFQELRYLDQLKNKAIVYCCGPTELVQTCQELAHLYNNDFKKETFLF